MKSKNRLYCTVVITSLSLMAGCATTSVFTPGELSVMRGVRHFECSPKLDAHMCHLVRSAAFAATQRGYPTQEGGGLVFEPGENPSAFVKGFNAPGMSVGREPEFVRAGNVVSVNVVPGVTYRPGDIVADIEDIFLEGRGE